MYQSMQMPVNGSFHVSPILSTASQAQNQDNLQSQDKVIIIFSNFILIFMKLILNQICIDKNRS